MQNIGKIIYLSFFILVFYTNTLRAEILKEIIITGNERISDETLLVYGEMRMILKTIGITNLLKKIVFKIIILIKLYRKEGL